MAKLAYIRITQTLRSYDVLATDEIAAGDRTTVLRSVRGMDEGVMKAAIFHE